MSSADTNPGSDYARLSRQVKKTGLLDRRPGYYTAKIIGTLLLFAAGWTAFALLGRSWYQLLVAVFLAVMFTQVAFLGHDAGHRQIFATRRANRVLGLLVGNLLIGLSYGWWVDKHNRHHAHPNQEGRDPDIGDGAIAFTAAQAGARRSPLSRFLARHQAATFFPLLLLEGLNLHVASVRDLVARSERRGTKRVEAVLLGVHAVVYLGALGWVLSPLQALAFVAVQQGFFGVYMGCSFAPNHKGMPILAHDDARDYLRRQVLTARNVRGGRLVDFALGGLNYQIEHHLFPSLPRPSLRRAQPLIRAYCASNGLTYGETTLLGSYAQVLRHLHTVGRAARDG